MKKVNITQLGIERTPGFLASQGQDFVAEGMVTQEYNSLKATINNPTPAPKKDTSTCVDGVYLEEAGIICKKPPSHRYRGM